MEFSRVLLSEILPESVARQFLPLAYRHRFDQHRAYGAFCALAQKDMKRTLVAYSSVNHMGYCLAIRRMAAVMGNPNAAHAGLSGAVLQMVNHGIITASLFLLVGGVIYDRAHTRDIDAFGGLAGVIPIFARHHDCPSDGVAGSPGLGGLHFRILKFHRRLRRQLRGPRLQTVGRVFRAGHSYHRGVFVEADPARSHGPAQSQMGREDARDDAARSSCHRCFRFWR